MEFIFCWDYFAVDDRTMTMTEITDHCNFFLCPSWKTYVWVLTVSLGLSLNPMLSDKVQTTVTLFVAPEFHHCSILNLVLFCKGLQKHRFKYFGSWQYFPVFQPIGSGSQHYGIDGDCADIKALLLLVLIRLTSLSFTTGQWHFHSYIKSFHIYIPLRICV